ncbi:MAG: LysR family transcriptional regulator, partial [Steroidobacteraceae bacterium]
MDLSNKPLRCFVAVAETQSFTQAAERLHMTQPSLSIQISQLEKRLGFQLFERTTREVTITPAGRRLLDHARRVIENSCLLLNEARSVCDERSNRLRLGAALYTFDLPERSGLVEGFIESHPGIDLRVDSHYQSETIRDLRSHDLDLALILGLGLSTESYDSGDGGELTYPRSLLQAVLRQERVELR